MERIFGRLILLAFLILNSSAPKVLAEDFTEEDIESEEAIANSDAAIAEKKEIKRMQVQEKQRANAEQQLAQQARVRAKKAEQEAKTEIERVAREVKKSRIEKGKAEIEKKAAQKREELARQRIEKAKLEEQTVKGQLAEAKKALEQARFDQKMAEQLARQNEKKNKHKQEELARIEKQIKNVKTKKPLPKGSISRASASTSARETSLPGAKYLLQDCNLRLGPSARAEVFSIMKRGEKVIYQGKEGTSWHVVGTPSLPKGYLAKSCL